MQPPFQIEAKDLTLVLQSGDDVRAFLENMPPEQRKEVSPAWLALINGSCSPDPWIHGFKLVHKPSGWLASAVLLDRRRQRAWWKLLTAWTPNTRAKVLRPKLPRR
jgi:hypothetical protein